jgi:methionine-rich copper-binding protein CopC
MHMMTPRIFALSAAVAMLVGCATAAFAHARLERASPAVGSTVKGSPPEIRLTLSEELEVAFSTIRVVDDKGQQVDNGDKALDPANRKILKVTLRSLPPGTYQVIWRVLSVDTHVTEGDYKFRVAP